MLVFALSFWELDPGGPGTRARIARPRLPTADFRLPQDEDHDAVSEVTQRSSAKSRWARGFIAKLLDRSPAASVGLDDLSGVAPLLDRLREAGAVGQVAKLMARAVAAATLNDPLGVASLLDRLLEAGAEEQVTKLMDRSPPATVALDNQYSVARLLDRLRAVGAAEQVTELTARLPAGRLFELHPDYGSRPYRFGRELDGGPALTRGWRLAAAN